MEEHSNITRHILHSALLSTLGSIFSVTLGVLYLSITGTRLSIQNFITALCIAFAALFIKEMIHSLVVYERSEKKMRIKEVKDEPSHLFHWYEPRDNNSATDEHTAKIPSIRFRDGSQL